MRIDADQLLDDLAELMQYADDLEKRGRRRGRRYGEPLRKTPYADVLAKAADGADDDGSDDGYAAHASTKAAHHEHMAELHAKIATAHTAMKNHYKAGAKGAHVDDRDAQDEPIEHAEDDADVAMLKARADHGDVDARLALVAHEREAVRRCLARPQHSDPSTAAFERLLRRESGAR